MKKTLCLISMLAQSTIHANRTETVLTDLYTIGAFRFDTEKIHCPTSPYYVDLRHTISHPKIFKSLVEDCAALAENLDYDVICGVPYATLSIAAALAYSLEEPLIMRRTQPKTYGTKKKIEGTFTPGMRCLLIEDVATTATSLYETIVDLEAAGLIVTECIVLFSREQGGIEWLRNKGYRVHVLYTITDLLQVLCKTGAINYADAEAIMEWTKHHQVGGIEWKPNTIQN